MNMRFNTQSVRIVIGVVAILLLLFAVVPSVYKFNSNDGVVNGRILIVHSPLQGVLHFSVPTAYGTSFKKGDLIAEVLNERADTGTVHALKTEFATLEGRIKAMDKKIADLKALDVSLDSNIKVYTDFLRKRLSSEMKQAENRLDNEKAETSRAKSELETSTTLNRQAMVSRIDLDKHSANLAKSNARAREIEGQMESFSTMLGALESGSFLGDSGHNDVPYSKQRKDQLIVEISLAESVRSEAQARNSALAEQIKNEEARLQRNSVAKIYATTNCLVWRMPASENEVVTENSELLVLLDCSSVFLDISVSETQFANIRPGDKIRYKLIGSPFSNVGEVIALRGSGSVMGDINLAAELNKNPRRDFRIWVKIAQDDLSLSPGNFFQIGRRVEAKIPRKWNVKDNLLKFVNVF